MRHFKYFNLLGYAVFAAAVIVVFYRVQIVAARGVDAHDALCVFQGDLQQRHDETLVLLAKHPEDPVHVYGITFPRAQLVTNSINQQATLDSLSSLKCP